MKAAYFILSFLFISSAREFERELNEKDDCIEVDRDGECVRCKEGYWLNEGTCVDCIYAIDWCSSCSSDGSKCSQCKKGFFLVSEKQCKVCFNGIEMCEVCDERGTECFKCILPYQLYNGICVHSHEESQPVAEARGYATSPSITLKEGSSEANEPVNDMFPQSFGPASITNRNYGTNDFSNGNFPSSRANNPWVSRYSTRNNPDNQFWNPWGSNYRGFRGNN